MNTENSSLVSSCRTCHLERKSCLAPMNHQSKIVESKMQKWHWQFWPIKKQRTLKLTLLKFDSGIKLILQSNCSDVESKFDSAIKLQWRCWIDSGIKLILKSKFDSAIKFQWRCWIDSGIKLILQSNCSDIECLIQQSNCWIKNLIQQSNCSDIVELILESNWIAVTLKIWFSQQSNCWIKLQWRCWIDSGIKLKWPWP